MADAGLFSKECDYQSIEGEVFTFSSTYAGGEKYPYFSWSKNPSTAGWKLSHNNYVGKKGKLTTDIVKESVYSSFSYQKAVLENCEIVYAQISQKNTAIDGVYFDKEIQEANKLIGKLIFVKNTLVLKPQKLITEAKDITYSLKNIERLNVIDISFQSFPYSMGTGPFFLKVKKENGDEGLIKYNSRYFYTEYPILESTEPSIISAIENQKIKIGMSPEETKLSWGDPKKINKSVGSWGVHEQWVYENQYLYFENGKLASFQSMQ